MANLRAVAPNEKPKPPAKPKTIVEAAKTGSQRELLIAMRDRIAKALDDPKTQARDLASLSRRQLEIARELDSLDSVEGDDISDAASTPDEAFNAEAL